MKIALNSIFQYIARSMRRLGWTVEEPRTSDRVLHTLQNMSHHLNPSDLDAFLPRPLMAWKTSQMSLPPSTPRLPGGAFYSKMNWKYFSCIVVLVLVHQFLVNQSLSFQNGDCLPLWLSDQAWGILRSNRLCSALRSVRTYLSYKYML